MHSLQKFLLCPCARLVPDDFVPSLHMFGFVIVFTVGPFAQPWSLWNAPVPIGSHIHFCFVVLILLTNLMSPA